MGANMDSLDHRGKGCEGRHKDQESHEIERVIEYLDPQENRDAVYETMVEPLP